MMKYKKAFEYYLLQKKKLDKIFIKAKAITPYPKYLKAWAVTSASLAENDPYPNNALTISSEATINPKLAGIDKSKESSKRLCLNI